MKKFFALILVVLCAILSSNFFVTSLFSSTFFINAKGFFGINQTTFESKNSQNIKGFSPLNSLQILENSELHTFDENLYKHYHYKTLNEFYYVNLETNKIEHYLDGLVTSFGEYGNIDGSFTEIKFFKVLQNGEFVILDSLNRLQFFDSGFNHLKTLQHIKSNSNFILLGNISCLTSDIYSNIYLADYTNGFILKASSESENFEVVKSVILSENSQITILNSSNEIVVLQDDIIKTNNATKSLENAHFIFCDALNFIYVVCDSKIVKLNFNLEIISEIELNLCREYNINLTHGTIYYIQDNTLKLLDNFAEDITSYSPPVDALNEILLTNGVEVYKLNQDTNLLSNPYSNINETKLTLDTQVFVLGETTEFENNFYYVLYIENENYILGYLEKKYLTELNLDTFNYSITPVRSDVRYYKYPTSTLNLLQNAKLNYGESYLVTREIEYNNIEFLEISLGLNYIYVLKSETLNTNSNYINLYLNPNAKLSVYANFTEIPIYETDDKTNIKIVLNKTTNVKILSSTNNFSKVSFIYENQIITGYVENKFVVKEQNFIIPITIILVLICIIVLAILLLKIKKESTKTKSKY